MGKLKDPSPGGSDFTFTPRISDRNRNLELKQIYSSKQCTDINWGSNTLCVVQFNIAHHGSIELGILKRVQNLYPYSGGVQITALPQPKVPKKGHSFGSILNRKSLNFDITGILSKQCFAEVYEDTDALINPFVKRNWGKEQKMSFPEYNSKTFTFHPKVNEQSTRIAESLGTDFMERQLQHIEKQKKMESGEEDKENDTTSGEATVMKSDATTNLVPPVRAPKKTLSQSSGLHKLAESLPETYESVPVTCRSKTMPPPDSGRKMSRKASVTIIDLDRLKNAKNLVERAVKTGKIFTIQGPYSKVRASLRKRGWVEKFYKMQPKQKKTSQTKKSKRDDDDIDDDDDDGDSSGADDDADDKTEDKNYCPPWEEDGGVYGIMSRMIRNCAPTLIWCLRRDAVDYRFLGKDQMVNHYCRAGSFTTKVGLCMNMRNVPWFENEDPDSFFPRCYRLSADEDKESFIADYRLTACMSVLKFVLEDHERRMLRGRQSQDEDQKADLATDNPTEKTAGEAKCMTENGGKTADEGVPTVENGQSKDAQKVKLPVRKKKQVPLKCLEIAMAHCEKWLQSLDHLDIDTLEDIVHDGSVITNADSRVYECDVMVDELREKFPQFDLDGTRNTWIVKPGAKSRGRGIMVMDRLEEMLKLVMGSVVKKEGKYVVQKYIERPLLVYNTKFDIRQWFLVTDWNPLTIYFYRDSYLRFCSQQYTLEKFDEAIHLANNSIQKNYTNDKTRSFKLPSYNMWSHESFKEYLGERGKSSAWDVIIYPGMKKAISCALLTSQDFVEYRKCFSTGLSMAETDAWLFVVYGRKSRVIPVDVSKILAHHCCWDKAAAAFELYGADFMLTEDLRPWLIEINSSPAMDPSTPVTAKLCANVLDDVMKVVVDRRYDRNCDIGRFELSYRQTQVTVPPYIGINLSVDGTAIRRPGLQPHPLRTVPTLPKSEEAQPILSQCQLTSPYTVPLTHSKSCSSNKTTSGCNTTALPKTSSPDKAAKMNVDLQPQMSSVSPNKSTRKREALKKDKSQAVNSLKTSVATVVDLKKTSKSQGLEDGAWGQLCDRCGSAISSRQHDCPCFTPTRPRSPRVNSHVQSPVPSPRVRTPPSEPRPYSRTRSARGNYQPRLQPSCVSLSSQFMPPKLPTPPAQTSYYSARIPRLSVIRQEILNLENAIHGQRLATSLDGFQLRRQLSPGHINHDHFPHRVVIRRSKPLSNHLKRNHQFVASLISHGYHQ